MLHTWLTSIGIGVLISAAAQAQDVAAPPAKGPLARLGSPDMRHGAEVTALAWSDDGHWLASGGADNLIHIWEVKHRQNLATLRGHTGAPTTLAFLPGKQRLLSAAADGSVRLWDVKQGKELKKLIHFKPTRDPGFVPRAAETLTTFALAKDGRSMVLAGPDRIVRQWDLDKEQETRKLTGHNDRIHAMHISADGKHAASCGNEASVIIWNLTTGQKVLIEKVPSYTNSVPGTAFAPGQDTIAISSPGRVKLFDLKSKKVISTVAVPGASTTITPGLLFSQDGKYLLTYNAYQNGIQLFGVQSGSPLRSLKVDLAADPCWALAPDKTLAFAVKGGDFMLWDIAQGKNLSPEGHHLPIEQVVFSKDGKSLFTVAGKTVRRWDPVSGDLKSLCRLDGVAVAITHHKEHPLGVTIVAAHRDQPQRLERWDWDGNNPTQQQKTFDFSYYRGGLMVSKHGRWLAGFGSQPQAEFVVFDSAGGRRQCTLHRNFGYTQAGLFSPDERYLAHISGAQALVFDFLSNKEAQLSVCRNYYEEVRASGFSPDGRLLALAIAPRRDPPINTMPSPPPGPVVSFLEIATGQIRFRIPGFHRPITTLAVSPDGAYLAFAGGADFAVGVVEIATGKEVARFSGHRGKVRHLLFSERGDRLVSASQDTTALVWDTAFLAKLPRVVQPLRDGELAALWEDLRRTEGAAVLKALARFRDHPQETTAFFKTHLRAQSILDKASLAKYAKNLDHAEFRVREEATRMLSQNILAAAPFLHEIVATARSVEAVRRAQRILAQATPDPSLLWREIRAIEILDRLQTPAARALLEFLAKDVPSSPRALEARAALAH